MEGKVRCRRMRGRECEGFGAEDAAAVGLYTFDFGRDEDYERNPYRVINRALASRAEGELERASGLVLVVLRSLRKLPRCTGRTLYRGVCGDVDMASYREGRPSCGAGSRPRRPTWA